MDKTKFQSLVREYIKEYSQSSQTVKKSELKAVIKEVIRSILKESAFLGVPLAETQLSTDELSAMWDDDKNGEYIQINPDGSVVFVAHGKAMEGIAPKGRGGSNFRLIAQWMKKHQFFPNIWQVNERGNLELYSTSGKPMGGLVEAPINEISVTGAVAPLNLPGNAMPGTGKPGKSGWVSGKGGSVKGVEASPTGMTLTPIGKKDMQRKQDKVYERTQ